MTKVVLAATFGNARLAAIAKGMLASHGIPAILDNATFSSILPLSFNSIGEVRLMVNETDLDDALRLLREHGDLSD